MWLPTGRLIFWSKRGESLVMTDTGNLCGYDSSSIKFVAGKGL